MTKYGLVFVLSAVLAGCASPKYNYAPRTIQISDPPIGSTNIAYVGDAMLRQGTYTEHDAIHVKRKVDIGWAYDILPGYYLKQGFDSKSGFFFPSGGVEGGRVDKALLADSWKSIQAYNSGTKLCIITVFNVASCEETRDYEETKRDAQSSNSFQLALIYSGRVGNKVNIGYREFSSNIARPAFNNDVEYDLSESATIGYKGARIQILDATNEFIKYHVLRNFNNAEF